jgi:inorganic pyrophosphatase
MEFPVVARCILNARPIGVIEAEQEENGEKFRNDRLIAVSVHSRAHEDAHSLKNLRPRLVDEITSFFVDYNEIHGKKFLPLGVHGPHRAKDLIEAARTRFAKSRKGKKK